MSQVGPSWAAARTTDGLVQERVLVFGSVPPAGRDLDLLVRPGAERALLAGLPAAGFVGGAGAWVRFADCHAQAVDLVGASDWELAADQVEDLYAQARAIEGLRWLVCPAPHHGLLILARRGAVDGVLTDKHLRRARQALADAPAEPADTVARARDVAAAWRAEAALEMLERALADDRWPALPPPRGGSAATLARVARTAGRVARRRRGVLVTFSGLDGSGRSTQAEALRDTMVQLGHSPVLVRTSVTARCSLRRLAGGMFRTVVSPGSEPDSSPGSGPGGTRAGFGDPNRALRQRSRAASLAESLVVAAANGWWQWWATAPHLLRGRIVICDRYTLDSQVHVRWAYGGADPHRAQIGLMRALSPRPARAYLLDVASPAAGQAAQAYGPEQVAECARLYRQEHAALGVVRLDGELPRAELCARIAREVWELLR